MHKENLFIRTAVTPLFFFGALSVCAQSEPEVPLQHLGSIVVQAQHVAGDTLAPLKNSGNRISAEQMQSADCTTLDEALRLAPSVVIMNSGARAEKKIVVRGFSTREIPLYIDGIPIGLPYDGLLDPSRFSTKNLESIELEKGFNSVMNGPNSLGGAINMRSTKPSAPLEAEIQTGVSSGSGYDASFRVGTAQEHFYFQVDGQISHQGDFPMSGDYHGSVNGETGGSRDHSSSEDRTIGLTAGTYTDRGDEYMIRWVHQTGQKEQAVTTSSVDKPRYWEWPVWDKDTLYFVGHTVLTETSWLKSHLYFDKFDDELVGYADDSYTTERWHDAYDDYCYGAGAEWATEGFDDHLLTVGAQAQANVHQEYDVKTPSDDIEQSDSIWSLAAEDSWRLAPRWLLVSGVSYDRLVPMEAMHSSDSAAGSIHRGDAIDTESKEAVNPQMGLWYSITDQQEGYISVAHKTRFPTLKDRYSYRMGSAIPNPELDKESATHFELGWHAEWEDLEVNAAIFYSDIRDTIASVSAVTVAGESQMQNVGDSTVGGSEASIGWSLNEYARVQMQYTYMHESLAGNKADLDHMTGVAEHLARLSLRLNPCRTVTVTPSVEWNSGFYEYTNSDQRNDGYLLTHLDAEWSLSDSVSIQCGVHNLFDENYELDEGYPEAGRSIYASACYRY